MGEVLPPDADPQGAEDAAAEREDTADADDAALQTPPATVQQVVESMNPPAANTHPPGDCWPPATKQASFPVQSVPCGQLPDGTRSAGAMQEGPDDADRGEETVGQRAHCPRQLGALPQPPGGWGASAIGVLPSGQTGGDRMPPHPGLPPTH